MDDAWINYPSPYRPTPSMGRPDSPPPRAGGAPRVPLLAYHDSVHWRDPTPPLPDPRPYELRLDRRLWANATQPPLRDAFVALHQRTGAREHVDWFRSPHYVNPARDVANTTFRIFRALEREALRGLPANVRAQQTPGERFPAVPDWLFFALGNPPLVTRENSARFVASLRRERFFDAEGRPRLAVREGQIITLMVRHNLHRAEFPSNFARYATIVLNLLYDISRYGSVYARTTLWRLNLPPAALGEDEDELQQWTYPGETDDVLRARAREIDLLLAHAFRDALEDQLIEAVQQAADAEI